MLSIGIVNMYKLAYAQKRKFTTNIFKCLGTNSEHFNRNIKYLDYMDIRIYSPAYFNKYKFLDQNMFEATITLDNNSLRTYKTFKTKTYDELMKEINFFLNNEIKI